jgi:hypothetical protein
MDRRAFLLPDDGTIQQELPAYGLRAGGQKNPTNHRRDELNLRSSFAFNAISGGF